LQYSEPTGVPAGISSEIVRRKSSVFGTNETEYLRTASPSMNTQSVITNVVRPATSAGSTGKLISKIAVPPGSSVPPTSRLSVFSLPGVVRTPLHPLTPSSRVTTGSPSAAITDTGRSAAVVMTATTSQESRRARRERRRNNVVSIR
jgi:hypothetical protein